METITVSILNFNGKEVLNSCLESIFKQEIPEGCKFHLIDNKSTDDSHIEAFRKFPIDVMFQENNRSQFVGGLNKAFEHAKTDAILFTTNDLVMESQCIFNLYDLWKREKKSIMQPIFYWPDGRIQNAGMKWVWPSYGFAETKPKTLAKVYETELFTTTAFIMSKKAWLEIGEFDEKLAPGHYEDVDYSLRAKKLGYRLLVNPFAKVKHIGGHSFEKVYGKKGISKFGRKNRLYILDKHYRGQDRIARKIATRLIDTGKTVQYEVIENIFLNRKN